MDTSGAVLLRTAAGVGIHLTFGLDHAYRSAYEIWGSDGRIVLDRAFTPPASYAPVVQLSRGTATENISLAADDQVAGTLSCFAAALRGGAVAATAEAACLRRRSYLTRCVCSPTTPPDRRRSPDPRYAQSGRAGCQVMLREL